MAHILIIEDDRTVAKYLSKKISRLGHEATWSGTLRNGVETTLHMPYDVVFLDVRLPDGNGIDALPQILRSPFKPEVIVMSGLPNMEDAQAAIQKGAWDYIHKPDMDDKYILLLQHTLQYREEVKKKRPLLSDLRQDGIIGCSNAIRTCLQSVGKAAHSNANVLIAGATGTGKELFARAIHNNSNRLNKSLVVVDCAALPETLVENLLFGNVKGIYTGADRSRDGLVAQAHGGTLFLDEVGELPLSVQKVFLRVLQERKYRPVGGQKELFSDFRLIAATNRNLDAMVAEGRFREDLLYRLRAIELQLPSLKERREDIRPLIDYYIAKICKRIDVPSKKPSADFIDAMLLYDWPGNVREMINTIETAIATADDCQKVFARHLPDAIRIHVVRSSLPQPSKPLASITSCRGINWRNGIPSLKEYRKQAAEDAEKEYLHALLVQTRNDVNAALKLSKLSRSRFYELLKTHNLTVS
jgi:two-component system NtrC family response regulator